VWGFQSQKSRGIVKEAKVNIVGEKKGERAMEIGGYLGKILRVDLSKRETSVEELSHSFIEKWVGGAGFGAYYLYKEVSADVEW